MLPSQLAQILCVFSGKPAYEMLECDADWAPTLHLGHTAVKASNLDRCRRRHSRAKRQQAQDTAAAQGPPTPDNTGHEAEMVAAAPLNQGKVTSFLSFMHSFILILFHSWLHMQLHMIAHICIHLQQKHTFDICYPLLLALCLTLLENMLPVKICFSEFVLMLLHLDILNHVI